jgi:hypothetical protein
MGLRLHKSVKLGKGALCLSVLLLTVCTGDDGATESTGGTPPAPIQSLRIVDAQPTKVIFEWELGIGPAESIEVLRDGALLSSLPADDRRYVDKTPLPGTRYVYSVQVSAGGERSEAERVPIRTPVPPRSEARLEGLYRVTFVVVESTLSGNQGSPPGNWRFDALCGKGPCDARLHSITGKYKMRLAYFRRNGRYEGLAIREGGLECNGVDISSRIDLKVHVEAAKVLAGVWTATRLSGTFVETDVGDSQCLPGLWRAEIRGRRSGD